MERWAVWCEYIEQAWRAPAPAQPYALTLSCEATADALRLDSIALQLEIWSGADGSGPDFSEITLSDRCPVLLLAQDGHTEDVVADSEHAIAAWKQEQEEFFVRQSKDFFPFGYSSSP